MYSRAAGHACSDTCYQLPCPLATNSTTQSAAEHTFSKIFPWPYQLGRRTDEITKNEFERLVRMTPMNAVTCNRSVNVSGLLELEYKVRCECRKPDFSGLPTRPVIELANHAPAHAIYWFQTQKPEELIATLRLDYDEKSTHSKCIPFERLTVESSLFWRSLIAFFRDEGLSDYLRSIIPDLFTFCDYVEKYDDTMIIGEEKEPRQIAVAQSILINLIEILNNFDDFDYSNELGRQRLRTLIIHLLTTIPCNEHSIRTLIQICEKLLPHYDDRLNMLHDIIRRLIDTEVFAETLMPRNSWSSLHEKRIAKEKQINALMITFYGVCSESMKKLNPTLYQLYADFIRVNMESSDMDVRNLALKCGVTFTVLNEEWAKDVFSVLNKQFFDHHHTIVWTTSVTAMFQLLDRYGLSYFDVDSSGKERKENPEKILSQCTECTNGSDDDSYIAGDGMRKNFGFAHLLFLLEHGSAYAVTIERLIHLFDLLMDCGDVNLMNAFNFGFALLSSHERMSMSDWQHARNWNRSTTFIAGN